MMGADLKMSVSVDPRREFSPHSIIGNYPRYRPGTRGSSADLAIFGLYAGQFAQGAEAIGPNLIGKARPALAIPNLINMQFISANHREPVKVAPPGEIHLAIPPDRSLACARKALILPKNSAEWRSSKKGRTTGISREYLARALKCGVFKCQARGSAEMVQENSFGYL